MDINIRGEKIYKRYLGTKFLIAVKTYLQNYFGHTNWVTLI